MPKLHTTLYSGFSIFITLFLILTAFFFFRIIKNKNEHTSSTLTVLENKMVEKKNISLLEKKINDIKITHEAINQHFVDSTKIDDFVGFLEKLGDDNNAKLAVKNVEASKKKDDNLIEVEVTIAGQFPDVMKVIGLLENSQYQIYTNSVYLNQDLVENKTDTLVKAPVVKNINWQADMSFNILNM